ERWLPPAPDPICRFWLWKRLLGADVRESRQELGELAPQRLVVLRDAGSSRQQLHGRGAVALARAIHLGQRGRSEHQRPGTEGPVSALLLRQRRQVRQGPFRVCAQAREDVQAVGDQETADSLV